MGSFSGVCKQRWFPPGAQKRLRFGGWFWGVSNRENIGEIGRLEMKICGIFVLGVLDVVDVGIESECPQ